MEQFQYLLRNHPDDLLVQVKEAFKNYPKYILGVMDRSKWIEIQNQNGFLNSPGN